MEPKSDLIVQGPEGCETGSIVGDGYGDRFAGEPSQALCQRVNGTAIGARGLTWQREFGLV